MSTKLYNGYLGVGGAKRAIQVAHDLDKAVPEVSRKLFAAAVGNTYTLQFDLHHFGYTKVKPDPVHEIAMNTVGLAGSQAARGLRDVHGDVSLRVIFRVLGNWIFAQCVTEHQELVSVFREVSGFKHHPYWDNTDPPEGISYRAWKARDKRWEEAFQKGICFTVDSGAHWSFNKPRKVSEIIVPSDMKRAKDIAWERHAASNPLPENAKGYDWSRLILKFSESEEKEAMIAEIIPQLPKVTDP